MKLFFIIKKTASRNDEKSSATIYVRMKVGSLIDQTTKTRLSVNPNMWDAKSEQVKGRAVMSDEDRMTINNGIRDLKSFIEREYMSGKGAIVKGWLKNIVYRYDYSDEDTTKADVQDLTVATLYREFLGKHNISEVRKKNYHVIGRAFERYDAYVRLTQQGASEFKLQVNQISCETLNELWAFFEKEHEIAEKFPSLYVEQKTIKPRAKNTLLDWFSRIRTFLNWCDKVKEVETLRPFTKFHIDDCVYGTPVYLTLKERDQLSECDLSSRPALMVQRDIFVFQCCVGCRVGDLYRMTRKNIIGGALQYIPRKTKDERAETATVPLVDIALEILDRYKDECKGDELLPFISEQKYNDAIKEACYLAKLDRVVTVLNPTTRTDEQRPLYEVVSSHMARRTFVGNLYKAVGDQNIVSEMSGHRPGSRAFARYRNIDDEMKIKAMSFMQKNRSDE